MKSLTTATAALETRAESGDKLAPWLLLVVSVLATASTAANGVLERISSHPNVVRLRTSSQAGDQFVSWILVILAVIAIGLLVVAAINGWFQGRIGELGN